jgi:hypothetical protein
MLKMMVAACAAACVLASPLALAGVDVGVSVQVSQPGVYGRVDIGRFPQPQVVVHQPVIIAVPRAVVVQPQPVYMWVPPGHQKKWGKHCHRYNACGVPVYFVEDGWYRQHVSQGPGRYDDRRGHGHGQGRGRGHDDDDHPGRGHGKRRD